MARAAKMEPQNIGRFPAQSMAGPKENTGTESGEIIRFRWTPCLRGQKMKPLFDGQRAAARVFWPGEPCLGWPQSCFLFDRVPPTALQVPEPPYFREGVRGVMIPSPVTDVCICGLGLQSYVEMAFLFHYHHFTGLLHHTDPFLVIDILLDGDNVATWLFGFPLFNALGHLVDGIAGEDRSQESYVNS